MNINKTLFSFLIMILLVVISCNNDDDVLNQKLSENPQNITELIQGNSNLSVLASALGQVSLDETLRSTTTYSVFAPNNDAFSGVDVSGLTDEELTNVLLNHVLSTVTADFTATMQTGYLTTLASGPGETNLSIFTNTADDIILNGVSTLMDNASDIGATNGLLHVVDGVLLPPTVTDHVLANPEFSSLAAALAKADLADALRASGEDDLFTVFAPNNAAFEKFMMDVNGAFGWTSLDDIPADILTQVLLYHVVPGANVISSEVNETTQTSLQGESFSINNNGEVDDASYTNANIVLTDVQGINGIVHVVDKVLLPDTVFQAVLGATLDIVERCDDRGFTSFLAAAEKAGLTDVLKTTSDLTAFVPNDDAFIGLFATINNFQSLDDFDTPEEIQTLADLLNYHLYAGILMASDLTDGGVITTIYGDDITADLTGDDPRLRPSFADAIPSAIVNANIGASNGVIHEINRVLVPDALLGALGIDTGAGGLCPVEDTSLVFFDWDANGPWWGNVQAENMASLSIDGSSYGRANFQTGGTGWQDLFWRNGGSLNGAATIGSNLDGNSLKFDINVIEPISQGRFRIRFNASSGVDAFYDWAPWNDTGEPFTTDGWETIEIPLSVLGQPDFSIVDSEFGMAFQDADILLNFAIDNVRFDSSGCAGPEPVADPELVFFDWDAKGPWWGNVQAENQAAISLDGTSYGRANFQTGGTGWQDLFWRNGGSLNGADVVGTNINDYALKFDIHTIEPLSAGRFRIRFNASSGVDAFYDWAPWNDSGEPFDTEGKWVTITIPCSLLGQPDFSIVDQEFGMAFQDADVLLNFAIDNVRFEEL